jgi:acetaldehyde dehydrogenase (acetylating)
VGWEWIVQGRDRAGTDDKRKNKMAGINKRFAGVARAARLRLRGTDEGVRRHTSWGGVIELLTKRVTLSA